MSIFLCIRIVLILFLPFCRTCARFSNILEQLRRALKKIIFIRSDWHLVLQIPRQDTSSLLAFLFFVSYPSETCAFRTKMLLRSHRRHLGPPLTGSVKTIKHKNRESALIFHWHTGHPLGVFWNLLSTQGQIRLARSSFYTDVSYSRRRWSSSPAINTRQFSLGLDPHRT